MFVSRLFRPLLSRSLASGCLWGVVTDAESGAGLAGVTVTCTDADGNTASTTTAANGLYAFDIADGPVPVAGSADFEISAGGYHTKTESRTIRYDDNPGASLANLSSFWEVQSFTLHRQGAQSIETELTSVDISDTALAPDGITDYIVAISAYDPDDPGGSLCPPGDRLGDYHGDGPAGARPEPGVLGARRHAGGAGVRGRAAQREDRRARQLDGGLRLGGAQPGDSLAHRDAGQRRRRRPG